MYEFIFYTQNGVHHGKTTDFLEFFAQLASHFSDDVCALFYQRLIEDKRKDLFELRVTRWNFSLILDDRSEPGMRGPVTKIVLYKLT